MRTEKISFDSCGVTCVGDLYLPDGEGPFPGLVFDGPLTSVKEQVTGNYARAMAERGFACLAFDHRFFGESGGEPRQYESPTKKAEDTRAAVAWLEARDDVNRVGLVGVCAGGGYTSQVAAEDDQVKAWAAVAGFFHDNAQQRQWMGDGYDAAIAKADEARALYEKTGEVLTIPAVAKDGERAMPLDDAFSYYGTERGQHPNYNNRFAVLSRADTLPFDAQGAAASISIPALMIHSEGALAPALARKFFENLSGPKEEVWLDADAQTRFYDDDGVIAQAADKLGEHFSRHLG
jgi:fermentation-respiration switch protein FrsA (DUF1100 family)